MKRIITAVLIAAIAAIAATIGVSAMERCRYSHEIPADNGRNKLCVYSCPSGSMAVRRPASHPCPLSVSKED